MTTIPFLPDRLNREPVVWRGLTTRELFLALGQRMAKMTHCGLLRATHTALC